MSAPDSVPVAEVLDLLAALDEVLTNPAQHYDESDRVERLATARAVIASIRRGGPGGVAEGIAWNTRYLRERAAELDREPRGVEADGGR